MLTVVLSESEPSNVQKMKRDLSIMGQLRVNHPRLARIIEDDNIPGFQEEMRILHR